MSKHPKSSVKHLSGTDKYAIPPNARFAMPSRIERHISILRDSDIDVKVKEKSAEFLLEQVQGGKDISEAISVLIALNRESLKIAVITPAVDAIFLHYLKRKEFAPIAKYIEEDKRIKYNTDSLKRLVASGSDITDLLPLVIRFYPKDDKGWTELIIAHLEQNPSERDARLKAVAEQMLKDDQARKCIPKIVHEGAFRHHDMTVALPSLVKLLNDKDPGVLKSVTWALKQAVEGASDLSAVRKEIGKSLARPTGEERSIAYILSFSYVRGKSWDQLANILKDERPAVRTGAYRAIEAQLNGEGKDVPEVLSIYLKGLSDDDAEIRKMIFESLVKMDLTGISIVPSKDRLDEVLGPLCSPDQTRELGQYLYHIAAKSPETTKALIGSLDGPKLSRSPAARTLKARLSALAAGNYTQVCPICRNIPRYWEVVITPGYGLGKIRDALEMLKLPEPMDEDHWEASKCPKCSNCYKYCYTHKIEYDNEGDEHIDTKITLERLDPVQALADLRHPTSADYRIALPALIERFKADLDHPVEFIRSEAAWALSRYYLKNRSWDEMDPLLGHADTVVRREAIHEVLGEQPNVPFERFLPFLKAGLEDPDEAIRSDAASFLAGRYMSKRTLDEFEALLTSNDSVIVLSALKILSDTVSQYQFDISRFKDILLEYTHSSVNDIQDRAISILSVKRPSTTREPKGANACRPGDDVLKDLSDKEPTVRNIAAQVLFDMAQAGKDISEALPALADMATENETARSALSTIWATVDKQGTSIKNILPKIIPALNKPGYEHTDFFLFLLNRAQENGEDVSAAYGILGSMLFMDNTEFKKYASTILLRALRGFEDISAIRGSIEKVVGALPDEFFSEFLTQALAHIYLKRGEIKKVQALLEHESKFVRGAVLWWLSESGEDIGPMFSSVIDNLTHDYGVVRRGALDPLMKYARYSKKNLEQVEAAVGKVDGKLKTGKTEQMDSLKQALKEIRELGAKPKVEKFSDEEAKNYKISFKRLKDQKVYLTGMQMDHGYRSENEPRFIFHTEGRIFDLWFNKKEDRITDISWVREADFPEVLRAGLPHCDLGNFTAPFKKIPKKVLQEAAALAKLVDKVLEGLANGGSWFHLKANYDPQARKMLHKAKDKGFYQVRRGPGRTIASITPLTEHKADLALIETLRDFPDEKVQTVDAAIIKEIDHIWGKALDAIVRIDDGEVCIEQRDDCCQRYFIRAADSYFYVIADGGQLDTFSLRTPDAVLSELLDRVVKDPGAPRFEKLDKKVMDTLLKLTDPRKFLVHLRTGAITIGGGLTKDTQWSIEFSRGNFLRTWPTGSGGVNVNIVYKEQFEKNLEKKGFGWIRVKSK